MQWTMEKIEALPSRERSALLKNALRVATPEALQIAADIVGLVPAPRPSGGLRRSDLTVQAMETIIRSSEGRVLAKEASDVGLPALAGIEGVLIATLGTNYGAPDTTSWAGVLVAEVMEEAGYVQTKKKPMPPDSVAKSAAFFEPRLSNRRLTS